MNSSSISLTDIVGYKADFDQLNVYSDYLTEV